MKKTIKDHIQDLSKLYPGQIFTADEIAGKVVNIANVEEKSVKRVLANITLWPTWPILSITPWIKRLNQSTYQFEVVQPLKKKRKATPKMKGRTFVAIIRDHSGSMHALSKVAMDDFNTTVDNLQKNSKLSETTLTVVECYDENNIHSTKNKISIVESNTQIDHVRKLTRYHTTGGTPLLDSIGEAITQLKQIRNVQPIDAFMVIVITDGEENTSKTWNALNITSEIRHLQKTNQWTFAFRVPRGGRKFVNSLGVPDENIIEWETTTRGMKTSSSITLNSMDCYYAGREIGQTSSTRFFADTSNLNSNVLQQNLVDISNELQMMQVRVGDPQTIKEFFKSRVGEYRPGCGFYQLVKNEKVQSYKQIIIHNKKTGHAYSGVVARQMLGLPAIGDIKVAPGSFSDYSIYVQSTSVNRILPLLSSVLYWKNII